MTLLRSTTALTVLLALAACGGGGGEGGSSAKSFEELAEDFADTLDTAGFAGLEDVNSEDSVDPTTTAQLPAPGTATYNGQIALFIGDDNGDIEDEVVLDAVDSLLLGEVEIDVNFTDTGGTFGGQADNFVDADAAVHAGTLRMRDGEIIRGADAFQTASEERLGIDPEEEDDPDSPDDVTGFLSSFEGTLTAPGGAETVFDGDAVGALTGENADFTGIVTGDATQDGTDTDFFGLFVAVD